MADNYFSIALVSGKGGVGKTTLATNLAWLAHHERSCVMIIDLDFQNLGATGLFSGLYVLPETCALDLLHNKLPQEKPEIYKIEPNLLFLPGAFMYNKSDNQTSFAGIFADANRIRMQLQQMLDRLHEWYNIDCFVIDCHGGIDSTSIAAAGVCDRTLVVTEADSVTFAGTLALLDSYLEYYKDTDINPNVEFIVNRIPSKYRWNDLDRLYKRFLKQHLGRYTPDQDILAYIPAEKFLADSFGEYPFQVKLAKSVMFTKKLKLILYELLNQERPSLLDSRISYELTREKTRRKIHRNITSAETRSVQQVFTAFSFATLYALFSIPLLIVINTNKFFADREMNDLLLTVTIYGVIAVGAVIVLIMLRAFWRVCGFFRSQLKFKRALFNALPDHQSLLGRLELWKLRTFFFSSAFGATVLSGYFLFMVFFFLMLAISPRFFF